MSGGGWTVMLRRVDDSVDFYRTYAEYVAGFGELSGNFWAGLNTIHALTSGASTELHVYLEAFDGDTAWALYSSFSVGDAASGYLMTVSGYSGTAGDSLTYHNNMKFSTHDNDQDTYGSNCALLYESAWWFKYCMFTNPNGKYLNGASAADGNIW
jgi:ficolin